MDTMPSPAGKSTSNTGKIVAIVVGVIVLLGAGGLAAREWQKNIYNKGVQAASNGQILNSNIDPNTKTGSMTVRTDNGGTATIETNGAGQTLPSGFPTTFPIMPGFTLDSSGALKEAAGTMYTAEWKSSITPSDIVTYYQTALVSHGFTIQSSASADQSGSVIFVNKSDTTLSGFLEISVDDNGNTLADLVYGTSTADMGGSAAGN